MAKVEKILAEEYLPEDLLHDLRSQYQDECKKELLELHVSNFLWNVRLAYTYPGILKFDKLLKHYPAVVIGVGPSLDKHIDLLKEYRKNIVILCVDAALPILVKEGIYPDFACVIDPTAKQAENFKGIDTTKFYTLLPPICHPSLFRIIDPQYILLYNIKDPHSPIMEQAPYHTGSKGALPAGVLTSGTCFSFAAVLGCEPIMFIGHDLSWPTPDKVYAGGIAGKKENFQKMVKFKANCMLFPDINGKLVLTHSTFLNFWAWFRDCCKIMKVRVINCTEAGILRNKYIRVMPFKTTLKKYASKELTGVSERIYKTYMDTKFPGGMVEKLIMPNFRGK